MAGDEVPWDVPRLQRAIAAAERAAASHDPDRVIVRPSNTPFSYPHPSPLRVSWLVLFCSPNPADPLSHTRARTHTPPQAVLEALDAAGWWEWAAALAAALGLGVHLRAALLREPPLRALLRAALQDAIARAPGGKAGAMREYAELLEQLDAGWFDEEEEEGAEGEGEDAPKRRDDEQEGGGEE